MSLLSARDPALADVVALHGTPPLWNRRPGFASLVRIILEQQVSLASGRAIYGRVTDALGVVSPESVERRGEDGLRKLGVTRQKARYLVDAARRLSVGEISLSRVARAPDADAQAELQLIKGVGPWTAGVYLLMALGRPDVWPRGDVALQAAMQNLHRLPERPTVDEAHAMATVWSPWRSVAARILWQGYLKGSLRATA